MGKNFNRCHKTIKRYSIMGNYLKNNGSSLHQFVRQKLIKRPNKTLRNRRGTIRYDHVVLYRCFALTEAIGSPPDLFKQGNKYKTKSSVS